MIRSSPCHCEGELMAERLRSALAPRYAPLELIGMGANGAVFKVADRLAGGEIKAVKGILMQGADRPATDSRDEFLLAASFSHPNLVKYFDLDFRPSEGIALTSMEYVEGEHFGEKRLEPRQACDLCVHLLRALRFLHCAGWVHGDIKPSNVLWRWEGGDNVLKLFDYHLTFKPEEDSPTTRRGTLAYMAPEAVSGGAMDARSDLYSVGVLLYQAVMGRPPFRGNVREVASQHLGALAGNLDESALPLTPVFERLLAKRPDARFQTAGDAITGIGSAIGAQYEIETRETLLGRVQSVPLHGREGDLAAVEDFIGASPFSDRAERILLIEGESGFGKSRFLRECVVKAQAKGCAVVHVDVAKEGGGFLDDLHARMAMQGLSLAKGENPSASSASRANGKCEGAGSKRPDESIGLADKVLDEAVRIAEKKRLLLALDNAENLDEREAALMRFLARGLAGHPVLLALAGPPRLGELLGGDMASQLRDGVAVTIQLGELAPLDKRALIAAALPPGTPDGCVNSLAEVCSGNPGVLVKTLESIACAGGVRVLPDGTVRGEARIFAAAPDTYLETCRNLLHTCGVKSQKILQALAVAEGEVEMPALAHAAGLSPGEIESALREIGLATSVRRTAGTTFLRLNHRATGEAIKAGLAVEEVRSLHDRLADALADVMQAQDTAGAIRMARHRLRGRDPKRGLPILLRLLRAKEAVHSTERILVLVDIAKRHTDRGERAELLESAGDLAFKRGLTAKAEILYRDAVEGSPSRGARLLRKLVATLIQRARIDEASQYLKEIGERLAAEGSTYGHEKIHFLLTRGLHHMALAKHPEALADFSSAFAEAERTGAADLSAIAARWVGETHIHMTRSDQAKSFLLLAFWRSRTLADRVPFGRTLELMGFLAFRMRRFRRAIGFFERSLAVSEEEGLLWNSANILAFLGNAHQMMWDWERARRRHRDALRLFETLDIPRGVWTTLANLSQVNYHIGDLGLAIDLAEKALSMAPSEPRYLCHAMMRLAWPLFDLGDLGGARRMATQAALLARKHNLNAYRESSLRALGQIEGQLGEAALARQKLSQAVDMSRESGQRDLEMIGLCRLAEVALQSHDLPEAMKCAEAACKIAETKSEDPKHCGAFVARGKVLLATNAVDAALEDLEHAYRLMKRRITVFGLIDIAHHLGKAHAALGQTDFAVHFLRESLCAVEQVRNLLRSKERRDIFLSDRRRRAIFETIHELRQVAV